MRHQTHLAHRFGGQCRFGFFHALAQTSLELGYYKFMLKTVSCCTKATKTFQQDAMSYVRLTKPYTRPCNLQNFQSFGYNANNSFIIIHSLHQQQPVGVGLFSVGPQPQLHPQPLFLVAMEAGWPQLRRTNESMPDRAFEPTMPTPEPQERPRLQKKPSRTSATICA